MSDDTGAARAPSGTHDVLWPESNRWEAVLAAFAGHVERAGYGLAHTPIFEDVRVFRRGIGEGSDVVGKEMYEFEDRGGRTLALRPEGTAPMVRAFVQHRPPLPVEGLVRHPGLPLRAAPGRPLPPAPPAGGGGPGPRGPRSGRRGGVRWPTASSGRSACRRSGCGSTPWGTRCAGPATSTSCAATWPSGGTSCAPSTASGSRPTRSGSSTASGRPAAGPPRGRPALSDHLCDPCRAHFARVQDRPGRPRGPLRARPPTGPGVRLLHPHHLRVLVGGPGVGPERDRRGRTLRRPGGDAGRAAHPGHRLRDRHRAAAAGLRRRGGVRRHAPGARRLRGRRGRGRCRPGTSPPRCGGPGCGPTGPSTAAP